MNAPPKLSKIDQLRARDGDNCWLCDRALDFDAEPNSKKAPTLEHLLAVSLGGKGGLDNLVLCHPSCNVHLGARPEAAKRKMRKNWIAARAKQAVAVKVVPKVAIAKPTTSTNQPTAPRATVPSPDWQRLAMIATASATFFAGLSLGMLVG